ncbi:MAG: DinB family protein [Chloroflexi bacterium]|nr:DinB family protein [Chloroflexota bacterium]
MNDHHLREQLVNALAKRQAHQSFDQVVGDFPEEHFNTRPANLPYSFWHLLEHIRICQWDILDYIENPNYQYLSFPDDYWPDFSMEADAASWDETIMGFRDDLQSLIDIVNDPTRDLCAQISHGQPGHSILREILVVAAHNSYHIGEFGILRGALGLW